MTVFAIKHLHAQVGKTLHVKRNIPGMSDGKWLTQLFAVDFFDRTLFVTPNFVLVCFQYIARELGDVCISTLSCSSTATFTKQFSSCSGICETRNGFFQNRWPQAGVRTAHKACTYMVNLPVSRRPPNLKKNGLEEGSASTS